MKKVLVLLLLLFLLPLNVFSKEDTFDTARSSIVMDLDSGRVLYENNADEERLIASITKIMTCIIAIEEGDLDKEIEAEEEILKMYGTSIYLELNEKMKLIDLLYGLMLRSGNDASVVIAKAVAGSEDKFVKMMNDRAKELGLQDTNFKNSHGLDEANHYSTAYDMAIIAKELSKHEKVFEFTSIYEDYLRKGTDRSFWLVNTNKLVRFYKGVDGLKTGYTSEAGFCLTATANINGMRIIAVVMGEPDSDTRNKEVSSIFDYVYAQYGLNKVIDTNTVVKEVAVEKGKQEYVGVVPKEDVTDLYNKNDGIGEFTYDIKVDSIKAPISKGDVVGQLTLMENNNIIKTIDLTVNDDVEKANIFELYIRYLKQVFN